MAKSRKLKKANSDSVHAKKSANPFTGTKKINPFEVHVNKEKFQILGRTCKHDKGLPGVSRGKAVKKRKETLGQEFRDKNKANQFKDRRIGNNPSSGILDEDVLNARFLAEKMAQFKQNKKSRFNLNDDEVLTHKGQTLEEIEQFRDERSDDEENDGLDASFTEAVNFGGEDGGNYDRKTAIEEMIIETKRRKAEVAKDKNEIFDLTTKLDTNFKNVIPLMGKLSKSDLKEKKQPDDYDKIMREMVFEPRGAVTDKLLSEEEIARKEKDRLEQWENERLARMQGDEESSATVAKSNHRSADDLDDGYFAAGTDDDENETLAYNLNGEAIGNRNQFEGNEDEDKDDDEDGVKEQDERDDVDEENVSEKNDSSDDNSSDDDDDEEDGLSDLKVTDSEDEEEPVEEKLLEVQPEKATKTDANEQQSPMKQSSVNLPFTIEMPSNYNELKELLIKHQPDDQGTLVERIIKCNHPKLDSANRGNIVKLFAFLVQYIDDVFSDASSVDIENSFKVLDRLNPHLYDLIHLNPEKISLCLLDVITEKYNEFKKNPKSYPSLETLVFFKLVSNFFSTSDFRHKVVTPCYIFIQHILSKARVRTCQDIAMGLFLVTIVLEFSQTSRRFLPAALNFLLGIIYLSIPKRPIEVLKIVPPFMSTGHMNKLLAIAEKVSVNSNEILLTSVDLVTTTISPEFKVRALNSALQLTQEAITIVSENVGSNYLAEPFLKMIERLDLSAYPEFVQKNCEQTKKALTAVSEKSLTKLVPPEKKPKALRLLEPRIEKVYDDKRRPKLSAVKEERVKLIHKIKRETKGAVREIRRDTEFLQKMRIQQQIQSDLERKEKVRRIYQEASVQQGELNELSRAKKKKNF